MSRIEKIIEPKDRLMLFLGLCVCGGGGSEDWQIMAKVYGVSLWGDKNVLKVAVVIIIHIYEYTKNHWILHFKWVNWMVCALYLNNAATSAL